MSLRCRELVGPDLSLAPSVAFTQNQITHLGMKLRGFQQAERFQVYVSSAPAIQGAAGSQDLVAEKSEMRATED